MSARAEQSDGAVLAPKRLEPVEHGLGVMQHRRSRIERERMIRHDARIVPTLAFVIIERENMIGKNRTECKLIVARAWLGLGGAGDNDRFAASQLYESLKSNIGLS